MKKILFCFAVCFVVLSALHAWAAGPGVQTVKAEGVGAILAGDAALARDRALRDAQRNAVELAVGVLIDSETLSKNFTVISDEITARSAGYIEGYDLLNERVEEGMLRVTIEARVKMGPLKDDLDRLIGKMGRPRVLFMIAEQDSGGAGPRGWWQGSAGLGRFTVDTSFQQYFVDHHFTVVDHSLKSPGLNVAEPSDKDAAALGRRYDAEVVVFGRAVAKDAGQIRDFNMHSYRAEISVKAIQVDNGQVIASANASAAAAHIDSMSGSVEALNKASQVAAKSLVNRIVDSWARQTVAALITVDIVDTVNYATFVRFKGLLKEQVRGVAKVFQRTYGGGKAKLEVEFEGNAQQLADELALKDFETFRVDILEASQNRIQLRFLMKKS